MKFISNLTPFHKSMILATVFTSSFLAILFMLIVSLHRTDYKDRNIVIYQPGNQHALLVCERIDSESRIAYDCVKASGVNISEYHLSAADGWGVWKK